MDFLDDNAIVNEFVRLHPRQNYEDSMQVWTMMVKYIQSVSKEELFSIEIGKFAKIYKTFDINKIDLDDPAHLQLFAEYLTNPKMNFLNEDSTNSPL